MRIEREVLFFDTKQEEKDKIKKDFHGIFVRKHPDVCDYAEILEIISEEKIQRPIGIMDVVDYRCYYYVPNINSAIEKFKDKVIWRIVENYPIALENGIPQIAVSTELEYKFFGSYRSKK